MPNITIGKRIKFCISSILKCPSTLSENTPTNQTIHHRRPPSASSPSTASNVDAFVFSDFNSLYNAETAESKARIASTTTDCMHSHCCSFSPAPEDSTITKSNAATVEATTDTTTKAIAEFSTAIATRRLTMSSPGRSNSIVDSAELGLGGIGFLVPTYSFDPYAEFRRSMEEMTASMGYPVDGEKEQLRQQRLCELLVCYLALNNESVHKDIVDAFADLFSRLQIQSDGC